MGAARFRVSFAVTADLLNRVWLREDMPTPPVKPASQARLGVSRVLARAGLLARGAACMPTMLFTLTGLRWVLAEAAGLSGGIASPFPLVDSSRDFVLAAWCCSPDPC